MHLECARRLDGAAGLADDPAVQAPVGHPAKQTHHGGDCLTPLAGRQLKRDPETREIPIIMLTARVQEDDRVAGLEGGADDYITKPFSPRELLARIKVVLRRGAAFQDETVTVGRLKLNAASHRVSVDDIEISLGPTEYRILHFFMHRPERVYSRAQLLDRVWGANVYVEERTVDVHIRRLRKALIPSGYDKLIQTVRGAGYRFSPREA